jgi:hypothetical protein
MKRRMSSARGASCVVGIRLRRMRRPGVGGSNRVSGTIFFTCRASRQGPKSTQRKAFDPILRLKLYDGDSAILFDETQNSVDVDDGLFNVLIGSETTAGVPDEAP